LCVEWNGRAALFASALEFGRAKREAKVHDVFILGDESPGDRAARFLKECRAEAIVISDSFPHAIAKKFEARGFAVRTQAGSLYTLRARKTEGEVLEIERAQRAAGETISAAREFLKECRVKDGFVANSAGAVTSEAVQKLINDHLFASGFLGAGTIAASGRASADPHAMGAGPIRAHAPIVLDVFPVSLQSHYYGDMTRTLFKGEPPEVFIRMYETVLRAQEDAIRRAVPGAAAKELHDGVLEMFERAGYHTAITAASAEGFIHGLGHGVGLEVHEEPRVGKNSHVLTAGNVITIEPGLYYPETHRGGIRIEDIIIIEDGGSRPAAPIPKDIGWAVV
jgi:Xaa-Pro aminopeptidase